MGFAFFFIFMIRFAVFFFTFSRNILPIFKNFFTLHHFLQPSMDSTRNFYFFVAFGSSQNYFGKHAFQKKKKQVASFLCLPQF